MIKRRLISLMIFALIAFPGYSETNSAIHWIKQIGNGENVNEPIFPAISYDLKFFEYMKTFPPAKELSFLRCMRTIYNAPRGQDIFLKNLRWFLS